MRERERYIEKRKKYYTQRERYTVRGEKREREKDFFGNYDFLLGIQLRYSVRDPSRVTQKENTK